MKHILIPCDFSTEAEEAFILGSSVARILYAKITVLYVVDVPAVRIASFDGKLLETAKRNAKEKFETYCVKHGLNAAGLELIVQVGPIAVTINQYASAHGVHLIVMGTKGASGLKEFFIGSNTEKAVRLSTVPVLAVRKAVPFAEVKEIVYPTSLSLTQGDFIIRLKELQMLFGAKLHLLYVNTPHCFMDVADMEEFIKFYGLTNTSFSIRKASKEEDGILEFVAEMKPDLLVMATHGRRGLAHLFSGSIAENVVNRIEYPIWTYVIKKTTDENLALKESTAASERKQRHLA